MCTHVFVSKVDVHKHMICACMSTYMYLLRPVESSVQPHVAVEGLVVLE